MLCGSAKAQDASETKLWPEDNADSASLWLEHFINPMHEANYDSLREIGYDQFIRMDNHPGMSALSSAAWIQVATSEQGRVSGRGSCVAFSSTGAIYYGATKGGLWKTTDNGTDWTSMSDTWKTLDLNGVAVDPINPNTVYAGTGTPAAGVGGGADENGVGVYKSEDGGLNWTLLSGSPKVVTNQMEVNPASSNLVYLAYSGGVSLSDDSGATWKTVVSLGGYSSIVFDPHDPAVVYAAGGTSIEKSIDSGHTWASTPSGYPNGTYMVLGMSGTSSDSIYLSTGDGEGTLALSTDAGNTWTIQSSTVDYLGQQAFYANAMAVNPTNPANVLVGGLDIYASTAGGTALKAKTNWTNIPASSQYSHADIHVLKYNPYTNALFALTDGGIYHSENNGLKWEQGMNSKLGTFAFVGGDMAINDNGGPDFFCAGAQDNGLNGWNFGDTAYRILQGGDGGTMFVSPADGQTTFGTYTNTVLYESGNRGADWANNGAQNILTNTAIINEGAPWYMIYDVFDGDPEVIACLGYTNLFLETQGRSGANDLSAFPQVTNVIDPSTGKINPTTAITGSAVAVNIATGNEQNIYLGTSSNNFFYSTDMGVTWTKTLTPGKTTAFSFGGEPQAITTDPNNAENVCMVVAGTSSKHFFFSTDNGVTWRSPETNLPALNYRRVAMDANGIIYIGADYGVLRSGDTGKTWFPVATGMPMALVSSLQVRGNYLVAATYGRGMYYVDITQLGPLVPLSVASTPRPTGVAISAVYPSIITTSAPRTNVDYTLPSDEQATLAVYDVLGRQERVLVNQFVSSGDHELNADLSGLVAGQHYLVLTSGGTSVTKPFIIE